VSAEATTARSSRFARTLEWKRAAYRRGRFAEEAVADYLEAKGLEILAVNLKVGRFELDIVARDGDTVVVVEVRTRGRLSFQTGFESVVPAKAKRVRMAGERLWRSRFERDARLNRMRFDVAVVTFEAGETLVEYCRAAF
jgi:putative endonuclease